MKYTHKDGTPYSKEQFLQKLKTDKEFSDEFGSKGIDQISELIRLLKESPDSRRILVSAWNPADLPNQVLPPCHYGFQVYTRELSLEERVEIYGVEKIQTNNAGWYEYSLAELDVNQANIPKRAISLMWNQRSVDTFLGLPFNIASYGLLLEIIAKLVNMVPDELIGNLGDTHLYLNHIEQAKEQIGREPYPLPTLNINTEWWPTESGEGGIGPISTDGFLQGLDNNIQHFSRCLIDDDLQLVNYQSHPPIKAPLSN
jgi:thymidylate synthase